MGIANNKLCNFIILTIGFIISKSTTVIEKILINIFIKKIIVI